MTLRECVKAYTALNTLMDKECGFKTAYAFSKLHAILKPSVEFFIEKEQELVNEFAEKNDDGTVCMLNSSQFKIAPNKDPLDFARRHDELENVDMGEEITKMSVHAPDSISASNIIALEGFLDFIVDE